MSHRSDIPTPPRCTAFFGSIVCELTAGHFESHYNDSEGVLHFWGSTGRANLPSHTQSLNPPNSYSSPNEEIVKSKPLLEQAHDIITGERAQQYGPVSESFGKIAAIWTAILNTEVTAHDVALCMIGLKVARATNGYHFDSFLDIAGYAACAEQLDNEAKVGDAA